MSLSNHINNDAIATLDRKCKDYYPKDNFKGRYEVVGRYYPDLFLKFRNKINRLVDYI
jgi:hypothetical protein